ncbi:MAG: helix-turn-helix domain-containing protein [Micrococcaceae bacterium]|nr:helix-turn-helix domain-containing protein [Micrococcaceae bacterium]
MQQQQDVSAQTNSVPQRNLDFWDWARHVRENFPAVEISTPDRAAFRAGENYVSLGEVQLFDMYTGPHTVTQNKVLSSVEDKNLCKLSLQFAGTTLLTQDNRECLLQPGDLALYVAHRPYTLHYEHDQRSLIIQFPQELLHLVQNQISQVTAVPISEDSGLGKVAVPLFKQLALNLHILQGPHALQLVRSALEMLVTVLFAAARNRNELHEDNPLFEQAVAFIDDHLHDPELGPQMIADYFYVSLRQLHGKFSAEDHTVSSYIRNERIRRIRDDLANPAYKTETVQSISLRYGLTDASHVSKLFKQTYGETPSGYRSSIFDI